MKRPAKPVKRSKGAGGEAAYQALRERILSLSLAPGADLEEAGRRREQPSQTMRDIERARQKIVGNMPRGDLPQHQHGEREAMGRELLPEVFAPAERDDPRRRSVRNAHGCMAGGHANGRAGGAVFSKPTSLAAFQK